jgi:hypothetical protein
MPPRIARKKEHDMARTSDGQPNTMDEPGGPETPPPAKSKRTDEKPASGKKGDSAAHGASTDADFEPPIVPGDTSSTQRK